MEGGIALVILAIQISPKRNQSLDSINLAFCCSPMEAGTSIFILPVDIFLLALGQLINRLANEQCRSPTHQHQCAKTCCYGIQAKQGKTRNLAKGSQSGCGADGREAGDAGAALNAATGTPIPAPVWAVFLSNPLMSGVQAISLAV